MKQEKPVNEQMQENVEGAVEKVQQEVTESRDPWYMVSRRAQFLIVAYLIIFVAFSALAWFVHVHPILPVDIVITKEFQENKNPILNSLMIAVSYLGNQPIVFFGLIALTALAFWVVRLRLEALFIIGLSVISTPLNILLKYLVSRPRPTANLVDVFQRATGQSFPSGHVMSYVAFWGLIFSLGLILFRRDRWWNYVLLIVPAFFVVMVGPSRIYLGDHWASDVLGAYMIGGLLLGLTLWLYMFLKGRGVLTPKLRKPEEHLLDPQPRTRRPHIPAQS
ncbi:phosphatase PAP2 family protein [Dictyobacter kobayashii]|uniref:Phosphatidic acid phosphatase type 2/haloperoxidase domain-containing protein n=1 Tax=Dictyobacter kobayashii TaxID=2014872 RepID=A0A402AJU9_9CHLR|nr:phosphatase PAP2 family protein [Dictyobacter kobayashii]GCE19334.1 hypothetical protein KDK_31340 [Dictyobacter kobayashii]